MGEDRTIYVPRGKKQYLVSLYQWRSVIALIAGVLVMVLTFMAFVIGLISFGDDYKSIFQYFTVLSNLCSAVGASFMIPYAVEGIRRKRFVLPHWVVTFQYIGAFGLALTLTCTFLLILPKQGMAAITGMNFWMHLITPHLAIILFLCVETGVLFTKRDLIIALIPYWVYMFLYILNVVIIGEENGGWEDIYYTQGFAPTWVIVIMMLALGYVEAASLKFIHNKIAKQSINRLTRMWHDDMESVVCKIEAFGYGCYMADRSDSNGIIIPMDVFQMMADRYDVSIHDLAKAYARGVSESCKEKNDEKNS